jgi:hypothetical protein
MIVVGHQHIVFMMHEGQHHALQFGSPICPWPTATRAAGTSS